MERQALLTSTVAPSLFRLGPKYINNSGEIKIPISRRDAPALFTERVNKSHHQMPHAHPNKKTITPEQCNTDLISILNVYLGLVTSNNKICHFALFLLSSDVVNLLN